MRVYMRVFICVRAVRCAPHQALLLVRGTASATDWKINLKESAVPVVYSSGSAGLRDVEGYAHDGMLQGARAILNVYGVAKIVFRLLLEGFTVKTVGHSLGELCIYVYMYAYKYIYICIYIYECIHARVYVYMCICPSAV